MKPKYGEQVSLDELYAINKQLNKEPIDSIDLKQEYTKGLDKQAKYGTPVGEPIGNLFAPHGGVKKIDQNLEIEDLYNIPEARAQAQSGWKLIGNSLGRTASEMTLGLGQGVGYLFQDDIFEADKGEADFENAWTEAWGGVKDKVEENWFPIYSSEASHSDRFVERLGDATWWASNFPTVASTVSIMIPGLVAAKSVSMAAKLGKEARLLSKMAKGASQAEALAQDAKNIGVLQSLAGGVTSRYTENAMESSERFKQSYDLYKETMSDEDARIKAGEDAARTWKYNSALLAVDVMQFGALLKPFKAFGEAAEQVAKKPLARALNPLIQAGGESLEESWQFLSQEEAVQDKPFGKDFFNTRFADYIKDPEMATSAFWGAMGAGVVQSLSGTAQKIAGMADNYTMKNMRANAFGDVQTYKDLSQDMFNSLLTRHYQGDKLDQLLQDVDVYGAQFLNKEGISEDDINDIKTKLEDYKSQIEFIQSVDNTLKRDKNFVDNPNARKAYAMTQLEAKILSEDITQINKNINDFYSTFNNNDTFKHVAPVNKELNTLNALKELKKKINGTNPPNKQELLNAANDRIKAQEAKFNEAVADYKETTGNSSFKKTGLPNEQTVQVSHLDLLMREFKHEFQVQKDLQSFVRGKESISKEEEAIKAAQKKASAKAAKEAAQSATNVEPIVQEATNNGTEEDVAAVNNVVNERAEEEGPAITNIPNDTDKTILQKAADKFKAGEPLGFIEQSVVDKFNKEFLELVSGVQQPSTKTQETYEDKPANFSKDKRALTTFLGKNLKDKTDDATSADILNKVKNAKTPVELDAVIDELKANQPWFSGLLEEFYTKQNAKSKPVQNKEDKALNKQLEELSRNSIIPTEEEITVDTKEETVGQTQPILSGDVLNNVLNTSPLRNGKFEDYNWYIADLVNNGLDITARASLKAGDTLTAFYDPDEMVQVKEDTPAIKNSTQSDTYKRVWLLYNGVKVGLLYDERQSDKSNAIKTKVLSGENVQLAVDKTWFEEKFDKLENHSGSVKDIMSSTKEGNDQIMLSFIAGTKSNSWVDPNQFNKVIPSKGSKLGQVGFLLPNYRAKNNSGYTFFGITTKQVQENREDFQEVIDLLKGVTVEQGTTELHPNVEAIHKIIPLGIIKTTNKKGEAVYSFKVDSITPAMREKLLAAKYPNNITVYEPKDANDKFTVVVPDNVIQLLQIHQEGDLFFSELLKQGDLKTPYLAAAAVTDWLGSMNYLISREAIEIANNRNAANREDALDTINERTATILATQPLKNPNFSFIEKQAEDIKPVNSNVVSSPSNNESGIQNDIPEGLAPLGKEAAEALFGNVQAAVASEETIQPDEDVSDFSELGDDIDPFGGVATRLGEEGEIYTPWNEKEELAWLKKNFPLFTEGNGLKIYEGLKHTMTNIPGNLYGAFKDGFMYISKQAKSGTVYHEAFHTVFWTALSPRERVEILKEGAAKYKLTDSLLIEEAIAEDFIQFKLDQDASSLPTKIANWFKRLYQWIQYNIFNQQSIDYLYYKINNGKFKKMAPNADIRVLRLSSSFYGTQLNEAADLLNEAFKQTLNEYLNKPENAELKGYSTVQILTSTKAPEGYNNLMDYFYNVAKSRLTKARDKFIKEGNKTPEQLLILDNIIKESVAKQVDGKPMVYFPVGILAKTKLSQIYKINSLNERIYETDDIEYEYDSNNEEEVKGEAWSSTTKEQSGQMRLSAEIRAELSSLPINEKDMLGLYYKKLPFEFAYGYLSANLADIPSKNLMIEELKNLSNKLPNLKPFYNKVVANPDLATKMYVDFYKSTTPFFTTYQTKKGNVRFTNSVDAVADSLISDWETIFYDNNWIVDNIPTDKLKAVITDFFTNNQWQNGVSFVENANKTFGFEWHPDVVSTINGKDLSLVLDDLKKGINVFEKSKNKLRKIAKLQSVYKLDSLELSFRRSDGKNIYGRLIPGFAAKQWARFKHEFAKTMEMYSKDAFYINSPLVQDMLSETDGATLGKALRNNMEYGLINEINLRDSSEGTVYTEMSDREYLSFLIAGFNNNNDTNYGYYPSPVLADSSEGMVFKLPKYTNDGVRANLVRVVKQEYARIKESNNVPEIKAYKGNKGKLHFIPLNVKDILDEDGTLVSDNIITEQISKFLEAKFELYWTEVVNNKLLDVNNLALDAGFLGVTIRYKDGKKQDFNEAQLTKIKSTLFNQFINSVYAQTQIITLTTGDPAFYKNVTDFYKRSKEIASPTLQMDIEASFTTSTGENITPGIHYNSLYVRDNEVIGNIATEFWKAYEESGDIKFAKLAAQYGYSNYTITDKDGKKSDFVKVENHSVFNFESEINTLLNILETEGELDTQYFRDVFKNTPLSALYENLPDIFIGYSDKFEAGVRKSAAAHYDYSKNAIFLNDANFSKIINRNKKEALSILNHELIHALLANYYHKGQPYFVEGRGTVDSKFRKSKFGKELLSFLEDIDFSKLNNENKILLGEIQTGIKPLEELITYSLEFDSKIAEDLRKQEVFGEKSKSFWNKLLEIILGKLTTSKNKLDVLFDIVNNNFNLDSGNFEFIDTNKTTQLFKSSPVNTADAQTFIHPNRYRKVMVGYGRWNNQLQDTWNRVVNKETLLPEDYDVTFNALKPFVFSHVLHESGKVIPTQNKNSEYMLDPSLVAKSPTLKAMYDLMEKQNIDSISFTSVVKVGEYNAVSLQDILDGNITTANIHSLKNADYGLQQETPEHHIDAENLFGSQIRKLVLSNIVLEAMYNVDGTWITGQQVYDEYHKLISDNIRDSFEGVLDDIGDTDENGNFTISNKKISNLLLGEVVKQGYGQDIERAVMLNSDGRLNIHPSDPLIRDTVEKLLNSVFKNRVTKQKIRGGSFIQVSGIGFSSDLQIVMAKDADGREHIKEVEVMLPWSSRKYFEPLMDKNGRIDMAKLKGNEELLKMIGYRIPTEDKYSMLPLKVKGFLPFQSGGTIMLPIEITTLAGSDFDVDKLYVMMPEFRTDIKYDLDKLSEELKDLGYSQVTPGYLGGLFKKLNAGEALNSRDLEIYDEINLNLYNKPELKKQATIHKIKNTTTTAGRNNRLIDLMYGILTNANTFEAAITPGGIGKFQTPANIIYMVKKGADYADLKQQLESGTLSEEDLQSMVENKLAEDEKIGYADPYSNLRVFRRNMAGKALVGIMANHSVAHAMLQSTKMQLVNTVFIDGRAYKDLNNTRDISKEFISFGSWVAAATDNAKDPNAYKVNVNTYTADVAALLNHLGVPTDQIFMLLSQPIVVKLAELYFRDGANFVSEREAIAYLRDSLGVKEITSPGEILTDNLLKGLKDKFYDKSQIKVLEQFLLLKENATSLGKFIAATKPDTKGIGPNAVNNELAARAIRETVQDENLLNTQEVFDGVKYPMFESFIKFGLIEPNKIMEQLLPLSNTNPNSVMDKLKVRLQKYVNKTKLNEKDLRKINDTVLSYLGQRIDFYQSENNVTTFPAQYHKLVTEELKRKYSILKQVEYRYDNKFQFPRLEFKNLGSVTKNVKADIKASWESMLKDPDPKVRELGLNLIKYTFFKEGFEFGPKSFSHLAPTDFFLTHAVTDDVTIRDQWYKVLEAEDMTLNDGDIDNIIRIFVSNNWKNSAYVPVISKDKQGEDLTIDFIDGVPTTVTANNKSQLAKQKDFVRYIKVPVDKTKGETEYVLMEATTVLNNGDFAYSATYTPIPKKGSGGILLELQQGLSILADNNKYLNVVSKNTVVENNKKVTRDLEPITISQSIENSENLFGYSDAWGKNIAFSKKSKEFIKSLDVEILATAHGNYSKHTSSKTELLLNNSIPVNELFNQDKPYYVLERFILDAGTAYHSIEPTAKYLIDVKNKKIIPISKDGRIYIGYDYTVGFETISIRELLKYDQNFGLSLPTYFNPELEKMVFGEIATPQADKITFTPDQQVAFNLISDYLKSDKKEPFSLIGKAGTGKTTLIKAIIDETPKNKKIAIAALSHKAKNVVYNGIATAKGLPKNVTVDTLAGILGMSMDPETGEFSQSFNEDFVFKNVPIEAADIVIIDESSMVNEEAMALIMKDGPSKIIFMGDKGQLPPIRSINSYLEIARTEGKDYQKIAQLADLYAKSTNKKEKAGLYAKVEEIAAINGWNDYDSLTFNFADRAELTTRIRQGEESPILPYADNYWNNSDKENSVLDPVNKDTRVSNISDKGNLIFTDKKTAINKSIKEFEKSIKTLNPNLVKIVSYRNDTRKNTNKYVHDKLFGENSSEFNKGEILMFFDSYKVSENISFQNSDEIQVEKATPVKISTAIKDKSFDGYILSTTVEVGAKKELVDIQVLTQESKEEFDSYISELFTEASKMPKGRARSEFYRRIYAEKNKVANLDYAYAITAHKSQGSTYNTVMILEDDIMSVAFSTPKAKSQAMYTAITRAKNNVIIVSNKNKENLGDFNVIEDKPVTLESQQKEVSLSKTKQDIIDNLELYSSQLEGITKEDIINADANKLGEILKKICK